MNPNDENEIRLRDQFAMSAVSILIDRFNQRKVGDKSWFADGKMTSDFIEVSKMVAVMAYQIADAMRKARLGSFT